ncbi:MFS transporter [Halococcus saccharolyticus]|uniref:Major facilitator superfamily protein n=1 Tax=Halococcus saccharolyticus DSM 5350 TaxID=1227455 RepID=M0MQG2_9EURY|nr:MFS transporter [Halococcus saccharolyticus]EMA46979.1 major facilitator superfamily protein [Halococcus saccharolyticus DSM 5350]
MSRPFTSRLVSVSNPREVWLITVAHAVNEFYSVALPPILPLLVNDFAITYGEAGALLTVFFATYSIFQLPAGMLADRIGQRWLLAGGMVVLAAGILVAAGAQGYWTLVAAEVIAGIGGSTYHPSGMSIISDLETGATEGKAMGIHGLGGVVGTALAPALVGGLAAVFDWRFALTVSAAVGVVYAVVFLAVFRPRHRSDDAPPVEADGGTDGGASSRTTENTGGRWSGLSGLVSVPLEPWVAVLFLANLAIATELGAVRTFVTSFLVEHAGTTAGVANGIFFVMLVGAGISSLAAGSLADSMDRRTLGFGALATSTVVLGATAVVPLVPVVLFVWFFLLGVAMWAALPAMNAITSQYSERGFSGSLFGVMLTAGSLGGAIGPLLFGVAAERFGLGAAFPLVAVVSAAGAVAFLGMYRL